MSPDIRAALEGGIRSASELRQQLGISQPTLSRALQNMRANVAVLGRGRTTRYALYRHVRELPSEVPVYRIDAEGSAVQIGLLLTIRPDRFWYSDLERPAASAEHYSLPWFITDMRPQGYLGRLFPQTYADIGLPDRITDWNEDQALYALARRGEDAVGNLIIGAESHARWISSLQRSTAVLQSNRLNQYGTFATEAVSGRAAGSSAAGEQPKFTTAVRTGKSSTRHVLVKFSGLLSTAAGARWSDLLIAEHLAGVVLREHGHASAHTEYMNDGRRAYLEVERFDRVGARGRVGLVSLGALDDEFVGERRGWPESAAALLRMQIIAPEDARELRFLSAFGALIGNTDMHLGNASFLTGGYMSFQLAPAYDMLPMTYAPVRDEVPVREFTAPAPRPGHADQWMAALPVARQFWERVSTDKRVSATFRRLARANAARTH
jgi:HipA-like C-terminal domain